MATNPLRTKDSGRSKLITQLTTAVALVFTGGMGLMLGLEHAHEIWPVVPALGYWDSFRFVLFADIAVSSLTFGVYVKVMD